METRGQYLMNKFTKHAKRSLDRARYFATQEISKEILVKHLILGIAAEKGSVGENILRELGIKKEPLIDFDQDSNATKDLPFSFALKTILATAVKIAAQYHYPYIGTEHLVHAVIKSKEPEVEEFFSKNILNNSFRPLSNPEGFGRLPDFLHSMHLGITSKNKRSLKNNPLEKFAVNLNLENQEENTHPIIGREKEADRLINILLRRSKNNPVLIGEPGVGKTAVVAALAQRINKGEVPGAMSEKQIYELDLGLLLSGTTFRGEFEQRMKEVVQYASSNKDIILFIDEIHNLIGAGSAQGSLDAANMLKPALAKGKLKLIGATTFDEYRRYIEKDAALERRFQPVNVKEPQGIEVKKILSGIKKSYEQFHRVNLDEKALEAAATLSERYLNDRFLPDKAIDLIDEAQARARANAISFDTTKKIKKCLEQKRKIKKLKKRLVFDNKLALAVELKKDEEELENILRVIKKEQKRREDLTFLRVTEKDIQEIVAERTGIPLTEIGVKKPQEIVLLKKKLQERIIGQDQALKAVIKTIQKSYSGIGDPSRPLGSFVFLGPTGVGKTYLAKSIAQILFKNPASFLRIDMSEFAQQHNVSRLIGAPAGYVGYEDENKLTDKIRRNPYSLILFDEIEKAHPEVFNILLQVLEDGLLTDSSGRAVNFKNTLIVMTSNLGARDFTKNLLGFGKEGTESKDDSSQKKTALANFKEEFLPELLNRIDHIIVFNALTKKDLKKIAQKEIKKIIQRLNKNKIKLKIKPEVFQFLAEKSLDKKEGARLLRKNTEKYLENPLAEIIIKKNPSTALSLRASVKKNKIIFRG
jgi:ATP-dependent Clp protease ATP-binding subunit ClpC